MRLLIDICTTSEEAKSDVTPASFQFLDRNLSNLSPFHTTLVVCHLALAIRIDENTGSVPLVGSAIPGKGILKRYRMNAAIQYIKTIFAIPYPHDPLIVLVTTYLVAR